ncbi:hypothetical protein CY652_02595 [Burkholderia sp. WAC0059]|nr:hypothetical protein CY652_02595 [Burkholderia sp. WAC0059]
MRHGSDPPAARDELESRARELVEQGHGARAVAQVLGLSDSGWRRLEAWSAVRDRLTAEQAIRALSEASRNDRDFRDTLLALEVERSGLRDVEEDLPAYLPPPPPYSPPLPPYSPQGAGPRPNPDD